MIRKFTNGLVPLFLFSMLCLFGAAQPVSAAGQVVTNRSNGTDLRSKINSLQSSGGGTLTFNCGNASINLASVLPDITKAVTIDGSKKITLSGVNSYRHFIVRSTGILTLNNIILTNGSSGGDGGAIYNDYGWVILNHATIQYSTAAGSGGAIVTYGQLNVNDSILAYNKGANGGAIYPRWSAGQVTIQNSVLHHNQTTSATDGWGGAILLWDGAAVGIINSVLYSNTARQGGAINNRFATSSVSLQDSTIRDNKATNGNGGGIYNASGILTTNNVTISGNTATNVGGGIAFDSVSSAGIAKSTFSGNSADSSAGGMFIGYSSGVTLVNATFSGNSAPFGGAVENIKSTASLTNVTIFGNSATLGASGIDNGTYGGQGTTIKNTVVAGSLAGPNCKDTNAQTIISADGNLSDDTSCASYFNKAHDLNGPANNPLFGPLAFNGGTTQTHLPKWGSPVLNAGIGGGAPTTDQRGYTRPQGFAVDVGAVEVCAVIPNQPLLGSPGNNTKAKGSHVALNWNDAPCADKYKITIKDAATGSKIQGAKSGTSDFKSTTLVKGKSYFWFVQACNTVDCTKSDTWKFTVK